MKKNKRHLAKEINANLSFLSNYLNKKFFYLLTNYQVTFQLLKELFSFKKLYVSKAYQQALDLFSPEIISLELEKDFNLDPSLIPPQNWFLVDHLGGNPANLDRLKEKSELIFEDVSLALGSQWQNKNIGTFGLISLFQLGANIDLFFKPPQPEPINGLKKYLDKEKFPVVILTKRFKLRQEIELILKKHPQWRLAPAEPLLTVSQKIGSFIQNLDLYRQKNQLQVQQLYLKFKNNPHFQPASIHQFGQPYFTFFPLKISDKKKED